MSRKYIELIRYSSKGEERFSYTKAQWHLAWLAVFVLGVLCGALR